MIDHVSSLFTLSLQCRLLVLDHIMASSRRYPLLTAPCGMVLSRWSQTVRGLAERVAVSLFTTASFRLRTKRRRLSGRGVEQVLRHQSPRPPSQACRQHTI